MPLPVASRYANWPPFADIVAPVINPASSLARNATHFALSSALPRRPTGICAMTRPNVAERNQARPPWLRPAAETSRNQARARALRQLSFQQTEGRQNPVHFDHCRAMPLEPCDASRVIIVEVRDIVVDLNHPIAKGSQGSHPVDPGRDETGLGKKEGVLRPRFSD